MIRGVRKFAIVAVGCLALWGCGFQPLHGTTESGRQVSEQLAQIAIPVIPNREGQLLRNYLVDRLTPLGEPRVSAYSLEVILGEPRQVLALRRDDIISRYSYNANVSFNLRDRSGRIAFSGSSGFSTDYEVTNSEFATLNSRENARQRVLELIADDIRNRLAVYLSSPQAR